MISMLGSEVRSHRCKRWLAAAVVLIAWPATCRAQTQGNQHAQKPAAQAKVVYVSAVVRDKKGKVVSTLNKEDFQLDEDGRAQAIISFIRQSDLPLTVGLLVDTRAGERAVLDEEREASFKFLDQALRSDKDRAFLIHFDHEVELLRDLTSDRAKIKSALDELQVANDERTGDSGDEDSGDGGGRHGAVLYDAVYLASKELMKNVAGRKALVVMSDGIDAGSKEGLEDAIEAAQRANLTVYSLFFEAPEEKEPGHHGGWRVGGPGMGGPMGYPGGGYPGGGNPGGGGGGGQGQRRREEHGEGKKVLEQISAQTGGQVFQISKKQTPNDAYAQVQEELKNQYTIGYVSDRAETRDDYHKIHLATKQADLTVQARDGYYSD